MNKFEMRRRALVALRDKLGYGGIAKIAAEIGVEPNYVSRMLYPEGKAGKKRIGEESVEKLNEKFPDWLAAPSVANSQRTVDHVKQNNRWRRSWPFSIPFESYEKLSTEKKNQLNDKVVAFIEGALPADDIKRSA